jgi:PBS lyase HEAT-like repeat
MKSIHWKCFSKVHRHYSLVFLAILISCTQSQPYLQTPTPEIEQSSPLPTPPSTLPELIEDLSGEDELAKLSATYRLAEMGPEAATAVPMLTTNLRDNHSYDVQKATAFALGEIGPEAESSIPELSSFMLTDFAHGGVAAAEALGKIGDKSAIPVLVQALDHRYSGVGIEAAESIAILTGQQFTDFGGPAYTLDKNGVPLIILEAKKWWNEEGQYQNWSHE